MKEFLFNDSGCCLNPNIFFDIHSLLPSFSRELRIETAYSAELGMWKGGRHYLFGSWCGGGCCVSFGCIPHFKTEKEAAIEQINFFLASQDTPKVAKETLKHYLNTLLYEQLCLF